MDPSMVKVLEAFRLSGLTKQELGERMGAKLPRQTAWQFLHKTKDPRISMLRKFADAVGVPLDKLVMKD